MAAAGGDGSGGSAAASASVAGADAPWLSPLALHLVVILAAWAPALRLLGWPLATGAAVLYLSVVEGGARRRALRDARAEWEATRGGAPGGAGAGADGEPLEWLNALLTRRAARVQPRSLFRVLRR